jgi:hypothetical protein
LVGDGGVGSLRIGASEHDAGAQGHVLRCAPAAQQAKEGVALGPAQRQRDRFGARGIAASTGERVTLPPKPLIRKLTSNSDH